MSIGTLISAFAGNIGTESAPSAPTANTFSGNPLETRTADNIRAGAQERPLVEQGHDFGDTLHQKISQQVPQAVENKSKQRTEDSASQHFQSSEQAQLVSAEELVIAAVDMLSTAFIGEETAIEETAITDKSAVFDNTEVLVSNEPIVGVKAFANQESVEELIHQASGVDSEAVAVSEKPVVTEQVVVSDTPKVPIPNEPVVAVEAFPTGSETVAGDEKLVITEQMVAPDSPRVPASNEPAVGVIAPANQESVEESIQQASPVDSEAVSVIGKPVVTDHASSAESETSTVVEKATTTEKPIVSEYTQMDSSNGGNNKSTSDFGQQVFSSDNPQPSVSEQTSASGLAEESGNSALLRDESADISEQIRESIYSSLQRGEQQITVRLNPPELGKVFIKFAEQGEQLIGSLEVGRIGTKVQIEQALPEIIRNIQDCGIEVKKLEVTVTDQQPQHSLKDQSSAAGQEGWAGQQSSANPDGQSDNPAYDEWMSDAEGITGFAEPQMQITDESINVLI